MTIIYSICAEIFTEFKIIFSNQNKNYQDDRVSGLAAETFAWQLNGQSTCSWGKMLEVRVLSTQLKGTIKSGSDISMFYPCTTNYINSFRFIISYKVLRINCIVGRTTECKGQKVDVPIAERTSQVRTRSGNAQKLEKPSFIKDMKEVMPNVQDNIFRHIHIKPMKMQNSASGI